MIRITSSRLEILWSLKNAVRLVRWRRSWLFRFQRGLRRRKRRKAVREESLEFHWSLSKNRFDCNWLILWIWMLFVVWWMTRECCIDETGPKLSEFYNIFFFEFFFESTSLPLPLPLMMNKVLLLFKFSWFFLLVEKIVWFEFHGIVTTKQTLTF